MRIIEKFFEILPYIEEVIRREGWRFAPQGYHDLIQYHFGLGTWIRNTILDDSSELYRDFRKNGITRRDDQSHIILTMLYLYLREK